MSREWRRLRLWRDGVSFSLSDAAAARVVAVTECVAEVFGGWFEVVLSGWCFAYLPVVVVDFVVAA